MSIKEEPVDIKKEDGDERKDPTSYLPEEAMTYEIKKKKKKKKKKKQEDDPFKDVEDRGYVTERVVDPDPDPMSMLDPEVNIKVEDIEVQLDINDFTNNDDYQLPTHCEETEEPAVKMENSEAVLLTFENVINDRPNYPLKSELSKCSVCHLVFKNPKTLDIHQKRKHNMWAKSGYICDFCNLSYENKNSLRVHIKRKHGPDSKVDKEERTCEICSLVFKGLSRLKMHMSRRHGTSNDTFKHTCEDCGLAYDNVGSLFVHKRRKHSKVKKKVILNQWFNCPFCPKAFNKRETYSRHLQRNHIGDKEKRNQLLDKYGGIKNEAGEITCKQCHLIFSTVNYLKLHMRRKHNEFKEDFRYKCRICSMSYERVESLKRHVNRKHSEGFYCAVCEKKFCTQELYLNHSHDKKVMECTYCGLIFATKRGLGKHLRCIHKIQSPIVTYCGICNKGFYDRRQLRPHLLRVHHNVTYSCKFCNKVFKSKESFKKHLLLKHPADEKMDTEMINCSYCKESCVSEFELNKHVNLIHGEELKPKIKIEPGENSLFQCTKCDDSYHTWEELKGHFEKIHYTCQCQVCGEIVPGNDLQKHIKLNHSVPEEMQCRHCEFKTNSKVSMTQHTLRHKNVETIQCDYPNCRYKSYYMQAMEKHKMKHKDQGVKLQCTKCPFQSMNKYILKYHEEAHLTGKKRYACDQCDYATILPANLVQHKYKHSSVKRFKCEVCPFASKYNTSLRFHVKKKHCDLPS